MFLQVFRYNTTPTETLGLLLVDGSLGCYTIEDTARAVKVNGQTRIPSGTYQIKLRNQGGMTKRYASRFGAMHKGMLHLQNVPNFKYVYINVGNRAGDSEGCILVGDNPPNIGQPVVVGSSANAYKRLYRHVALAVENGGAKIQIVDMA